MEKLCNDYNLLENNHGLIRIPFLVKGRLVMPPQTDIDTVINAFRDSRDLSRAQLPEALAIRQAVIDRQTMSYTGDYIYQIMPLITAQDLIEDDITMLAHELYALSVDDILSFLEKITGAILENAGVALKIRELYRLTTEFPDAMLDSWFASFASIFHLESMRRMIDNELSFQGKPGGDFLNGWVQIPVGPIPESSFSFTELLPDNNHPLKNISSNICIRAMPTRQLHITAGNTPEVPLISALRAVLTKSPAVIKLPFGAILPGALFTLAAVTAAPEHPLTRHLSLVYWQGGNTTIENELFGSGCFDRVIVWGSQATVASVISRSPYTRTICFNPRYGISMIGAEALSASAIEKTASLAARDVLYYNQQACASSLVHYIEGTEAKADEYAAILCDVLRQAEAKMPDFLSPATIGKVKRLRRGRYAGAHWHVHQNGTAITSAVVVVPDEFDILEHPMSRFVIVRPVPSLKSAMKYLHPGVSVVGLFPESLRLELRDEISARGVSSVVPLGAAGVFFTGMPHDGMRVLSELVDWKIG